MRDLSFRKGIVAAAKAEILSLTAFEVGPFGWMALMASVFFPNPHLMPTSPVFWFLMRIGMVVGYVTSRPANVWLIRRGIKEARYGRVARSPYVPARTCWSSSIPSTRASGSRPSSSSARGSWATRS